MLSNEVGRYTAPEEINDDEKKAETKWISLLTQHWLMAIAL